MQSKFMFREYFTLIVARQGREQALVSTIKHTTLGTLDIMQRLKMLNLCTKTFIFIAWRRVGRTLPRSQPSGHLYQYSVPEALYREHAR